MSFWFQQAADKLATVYQRHPGGAGATYSAYSASRPCYHYPHKPGPDDVTLYGQVDTVLVDVVFDEGEPLPLESILVIGGRGYQSVSPPVRTASIGVGEGGFTLVVTRPIAILPAGVS